MGSKKEELEEEKVALKSKEGEEEGENEDDKGDKNKAETKERKERKEGGEEEEEEEGSEGKKEEGECTASGPQTTSYDEEMKSYQIKDDCRIPRLFLKLYFGGGALLYSLLTIWVFFACLFTDISFRMAGLYYMIWITFLIWLSTGLTVVCSKLGKKLFVTAERRDQIYFGVSVFLKVFTDALIFHALIVALKDIHVDLYHEFFQFIGPLIYFALLYLVLLVEIFMAFLTVALIEDSCKCFAYMEIFCKFREEFMLKYCTVEEV